MSQGLKKISTVIIQSNAYGTRDNGGRNENAGDGFGEDGKRERILTATHGLPGSCIYSLTSPALQELTRF